MTSRRATRAWSAASPRRRGRSDPGSSSAGCRPAARAGCSAKPSSAPRTRPGWMNFSTRSTVSERKASPTRSGASWSASAAVTATAPDRLRLNEENPLSRLIVPRTLKGFRDYPPPLMIPREQVLEIARRVYRSYGFAPIDTPAIEYTEILLAKVEEGAEIQKQLYRFEDNGGRDVALRFDLTVPFARFTAEHFNTLGMPFKRYANGTVWRVESPQGGRC